MWRYLRFWSLPAANPDDPEVLDGVTDVLEAAEMGRYHVAHRCDYGWGETFGEFRELLFKLGGFTPR